VRNVLIAIGNSGDATLVPEAEQLLGDDAPLVRGAAVWALGRLDRDRLALIATQRRQSEDDPLVQEEWAAMLTERT
jgi:epoxyqueuosine reductase